MHAHLTVTDSARDGKRVVSRESERAVKDDDDDDDREAGGATGISNPSRVREGEVSG